MAIEKCQCFIDIDLACSQASNSLAMDSSTKIDSGRAVLATTSPLLEQMFRRLSVNQLTIEIVAIPDAVKMLSPGVDLFFIQEF